MGDLAGGPRLPRLSHAQVGVSWFAVDINSFIYSFIHSLNIYNRPMCQGPEKTPQEFPVELMSPQQTPGHPN